MTTSYKEMEKNLFNMAMKGKWKKVIKIYEEDDKAHHAQITPSGETALHVAIAASEESVVRDLIRHISQKQGRDAAEVALKIPNDRGDTPLHFAASMGNHRMCCYIAKENSSLVEVQNKEGETPLFLAALRGKMKAFLYLHYICRDQHNISYCCRNDGQTVLHCAITGEYFELAFQIIQLYPELVNSVDKDGLSPLHILAAKPFAFKSGSNLGILQRIFYPITRVSKLKLAQEDFKTYETEPGLAPPPEPLPPYLEKSITYISKVIEDVTIKKNTEKKNTSGDTENPEEPKDTLGEKHKEQQLTDEAKGHQSFPAINAVKITIRAILWHIGIEVLILLSLCLRFIMPLPLITYALFEMFQKIIGVRQKKKKHKWSIQIMNELLKHASINLYENTGASPEAGRSHKEDGGTTSSEIIDGGGDSFAPSLTDQQDNYKGRKGKEKVCEEKGGGGKKKETAFLIAAKNGVTEMVAKIGKKKETAFLIAAKNGVMEMVEKILETFPVAIQDVDENKKNIVLLAAEHRQLSVYRLLLHKKTVNVAAFQQADNKGNNALHLAAMLPGDSKPRLDPCPALQMQWEIQWYKYVKRTMPANFFFRYNKDGKTPEELFVETHEQLLQESSKWLNGIANSCSVVGGLFVTITFSTSTSIPGRVKEETGKPYLENQRAFEVFILSSQVAFYSSIIAVVMFLSILMSGQQMSEFKTGLFRKLLWGLSALYLCIVSTLVSFSFAHFFVFKAKLQQAASPIYAATCAVVTFFAIVQFPLFFQLFLALLMVNPKSKLGPVIPEYLSSPY